MHEGIRSVAARVDKALDAVGAIEALLKEFDWTPRAPIRSLDIQDTLKAQIAQAVRAADPSITIRVDSGGQTSKRIPGTRGKTWTGSTRHNDGGAADIVLLRDGKQLRYKGNEKLFDSVIGNLGRLGVKGIGLSTKSNFIHAGGPQAKGNQRDPTFWNYNNRTTPSAKKAYLEGFKQGNGDGLVSAGGSAPNPLTRGASQTRLANVNDIDNFDYSNFEGASSYAGKLVDSEVPLTPRESAMEQLTRNLGSGKQLVREAAYKGILSGAPNPMPQLKREDEIKPTRGRGRGTPRELALTELTNQLGDLGSLRLDKDAVYKDMVSGAPNPRARLDRELLAPLPMARLDRGKNAPKPRARLVRANEAPIPFNRPTQASARRKARRERRTDDSSKGLKGLDEFIYNNVTKPAADAIADIFPQVDAGQGLDASMKQLFNSRLEGELKPIKMVDPSEDGGRSERARDRQNYERAKRKYGR